MNIKKEDVDEKVWNEIIRIGGFGDSDHSGGVDVGGLPKAKQDEIKQLTANKKEKEGKK